jgi:glycosyltransferase involved in cell wall biosynthesis
LLWESGRSYRLVVIGAAGAHEPSIISELRALATDGTGRLIWLECAGDAEIRRVMSEVTATIFISELEGYGLPAVESLAAGCPLIAHKSLPALANLAADGQVRLDVVNAPTIAAAIEELAQPARRDALTAEAAALTLTTWDQFVHSLAHWAKDTLAQGAASHIEIDDRRQNSNTCI